MSSVLEDSSSSSESSSNVGELLNAVLSTVKAYLNNRRWLTKNRKEERRVQHRTPRHPENAGLRRLRDNPHESEWWRLLQNETIVEPASRDAQSFRRDFRVPFKVYNFLYQNAKQATKENGSLIWPDRDALGQPTHPLSLKILAALHILGHGECFRSVEGRTGIDEDTIREFFHTFMDWMVQRFYAEFITVPYDEQLAFVVSDYEKIGFPGAVGSVDCVHIPWDRCPYEYRQMNRSGKDGFPTRVYEVTYLIP
jgi:hypothetical protein